MTLCSQPALSRADLVAHGLTNTMTLVQHMREAPCLCRYLDGSVDMLDQFMADSAWSATSHSCDANYAAPSATMAVLGLQLLSHSASSADAQLQATTQCTKSTAAQEAQQGKVLAPLADVHARPFRASTAQTDTPCVNDHSNLPDKAVQRSTSFQEPQQGIPVWHKDDLSYEQFVQRFMQLNLPVMIQVSWMTGLASACMALACICCTQLCLPLDTWQFVLTSLGS